MILGAEAVDVLYRFQSSDLAYQNDDCLDLVFRLQPHLFDLHGMVSTG